jgi:hypothetical protein
MRVTLAVILLGNTSINHQNYICVVAARNREMSLLAKS